MAVQGTPFPRFTAADMGDDRGMLKKLNQLVTSLELRLQAIEGPLVDPRSPAGGEEAYVVSNAIETRAFDASTATATVVANVLGTFLDDLYNQGRLR